MNDTNKNCQHLRIVQMNDSFNQDVQATSKFTPNIEEIGKNFYFSNSQFELTYDPSIGSGPNLLNQNTQSPNMHHNALLEWDCLFGVASQMRWQNFALLFVVIWDAGPRNQKTDELKGEVENLKLGITFLEEQGGAEAEQCQEFIKMLDSYVKYWEKNESRYREEYTQLLKRDRSFLEGRSNLLEKFHGLDESHSKNLRMICQMRIKSFAKFALYINQYLHDHPARKKFQSENNVAQSSFNDQRQIFNERPFTKVLGESSEESFTKVLGKLATAREEIKKEPGELKAEKGEQKSKEILTSKSVSTFLSDKERIEELEKQVKSLNQEAGKYQAALGRAINVRCSDDDPNSSVKLNNEFDDIHYSIEAFVKIKGSKMKLRDRAARSLLENYKSLASTSVNAGYKLAVQAALERRTLETIMNIAERYLNTEIMSSPETKVVTRNKALMTGNNDKDSNNDFTEIEKIVISSMKTLVENMELFEKYRRGSDHITPISRIKISQQVYATLGSRAFNNSKHPLIQEIEHELLTLMANHREVLDEIRKKELDEMAAHIGIDTIKIFQFRLKTQSPIPEYRFFEAGEHIDPIAMQGTWDGDIEEYEIDICMFPVIGVNLDDIQDRRVFNKARVIVRPKANNTQKPNNIWNSKK
ncbi:hypothetical protein G9A89_015825 [Geosiphon pyriformis]|nr:hypothetical protein G9A89_015825 [Geosiphon pyriformis]